MKPGDLTDRRFAAKALGLSYSTLRVYEKSLGEILRPQTRRGSNRTTLFTQEGMEILAKAVQLKKSGWPFGKLAENWSAGSPDVTVVTLQLQRKQQKRIENLERELARLMGRVWTLESRLSGGGNQ